MATDISICSYLQQLVQFKMVAEHQGVATVTTSIFLERQVPGIRYQVVNSCTMVIQTLNKFSVLKLCPKDK
jgi:hypothetical protein